MTGVCGAGVRDLAMLRIVLTRPIGEEDDPEKDPEHVKLIALNEEILNSDNFSASLKEVSKAS